MSDTERARVVPLEAGAGPDNPPCPACGEPLFGWLAAQPGLAGPSRRCESCGLGVLGDPAGPSEALAALDRTRQGEDPRIANRASVAASLGGAGWAALGPDVRYLFTVEAVRRLAAQRDQVVTRARWRPDVSLVATWQTVLNSVTFGHDVAIGGLGQGVAIPARKRWQRRIDGLASLALAIPAAAIALPIELAGAILGRGAVVSLRLEVL